MFTFAGDFYGNTRCIKLINFLIKIFFYRYIDRGKRDLKRQIFFCFFVATVCYMLSWPNPNLGLLEIKA